MGVGKLSLPTRPKDTTTKQACAAVGQCELMYTYDRLFNAYNHTVAQILLTGVDVEHTERRVNFQNTLSRLLELGALPIINENDTVLNGAAAGAAHSILEFAGMLSAFQHQLCAAQNHLRGIFL